MVLFLDDVYQMPNLVNHPSDDGIIVMLAGSVDLAESEPAKSSSLRGFTSDAAFLLNDCYFLCHCSNPYKLTLPIIY